MIENKKIKNDEYLSYIIIAYYYLRIINNIGKRLLPSFLLYIVLMIVFIIFAKKIYIGIKSILKYKGIEFLSIELLLLFLYVLSYVADIMKISTLLSYIFWTLGACIPLAFAMFIIKNKVVFYNLFIKNSFFMLVLLSLVFLIRDDDVVYIMSFSYLVLVILLFHLNEFIAKRKSRYIFLVIYEIMLIIIYGSRGSLLCLAIYLIFVLFIKQENYILKVIYILLMLSLIVFYDKLGNAIIHTLDFYGYNNRTLTLLFGDITYLSGRDVIIEKAIDMILHKPVIGWGLANEIEYINVYPHNIIIELILDFGIPIGGLLTFLILVAIIKTIKITGRIKDTQADMTLIFMCCGLISLLISGTYLKNIEFFLFVALLFPKKEGNMINGKK